MDLGLPPLRVKNLVESKPSEASAEAPRQHRELLRHDHRRRADPAEVQEAPAGGRAGRGSLNI